MVKLKYAHNNENNFTHNSDKLIYKNYTNKSEAQLPHPSSELNEANLAKYKQ